MSSSKNTSNVHIVNRRIRANSSSPVPPVRFRSWQDQSVRQIDRTEEEATNAKKRRPYLRWYHNHDVRLLIAATITGIIAAIVYYSTKSI